MHKILLEKPRFDQIFFVSLEIFKKNWKKIFKMYVIFLIAISLLGILNYLFGDYMYTFQESNSAILVLNIFEAIVSIYISIIPFIGLLYFVKDKLYESD